MLWTWERLRSTLVALELPEGQYVVGLAGAMLANESVGTTTEVELLATDALYDELCREGWRRRTTDDALCCPGEPGLVVRGGDVGDDSDDSDGYLAPIDGLVVEARHQDGVAVVSMLQLDRVAVEEFLARAAEAGEPEPGRSTWTWRRLSIALTALELPRADYVVGLSGALLANDSQADVDDVELLVTGELYDALVRRGWPRGSEGVLLCPTEDDLSARTDDVSDTYLLAVADLVADAWHKDEIPLVSMLRVRPEAVESALKRGR